MCRTNSIRLALCLVSLFAVGVQALANEVSFSRDVLPILSDRCFHCHGPDPDNREADLRLDIEQAAKEDSGSGAPIVPGKPDQSEVFNRIVAESEDELMPPPDSHRKPLTKRERDTIRRWISQGAKWGKHWSFEPIHRPTVPEGESNPIDAFVAAKLHSEGLAFSQPASPATQIRRLNLDLTGLSPTPAQVNRFTKDPSDQVWWSEIERIFASPRYAERMAMWWLDAARYSDSDGFQQDATRQNWPWRDWVIEQFQNNVPFDQFTIEQFAGDLLPDATVQQKLATCFHRNHMTNGEGGRDPEESRIDYVIDRVNTMGTVWLGLTLNCVQCHSHKFDPISQQDYYSLFAFFNSIDENGKAGMGAKPYLEFQSPQVARRIEELQPFLDHCREIETSEREAAVKRFDQWLAETISDPPMQHRVWWTPRPSVTGSEGTEFQVEDDNTVQSVGPTPMHDDYRVTLQIPEGVTMVTGWRVEVLPHQSHIDGRFSRSGNGEFTLTSVRILGKRSGSPSERQLEMVRAVADYESKKERKSVWDRRYANIRETLNDDARDGWTTEGAATIEPHVGVYELAQPWMRQQDDRLVIVLRQRSTHGHANIGRFRISLATERGETVQRVDGGSPIAELIQSLSESATADEIDESLKKRLLDQFLLGDDRYQAASRRVKIADQQLRELRNQQKPRKVMVLAERKEPRETHVLVRGVWDAKGETVQRGIIPSVLNQQDRETNTRLDLAHWLLAPENPLTARVLANHLWQIMFGQGLVRTPEDFGLQGERPSHPELLDWLASELIENQWDLQHLLALIATSKTYRQSSASSEALIERDPTNQLLARAPRFRLPAWMIRDNALQVSGLLNPAVGGPPVRPYQPDGVWAEITMGRFDYEPSLGPAQYRRTVYSFWRRSVAPTFLFDSAQRRVCEVGVRRTNTPLHALTLMNDPTILEASRALADSAMQQCRKTSTADAIDTLSFRVLSRKLADAERTPIETVWNEVNAFYRNHRDEAMQFTTVGQQSAPEPEHAAETAAWMTVANLLLNLDEAMTRE